MIFKTINRIFRVFIFVIIVNKLNKVRRQETIRCQKMLIVYKKMKISNYHFQKNQTQLYEGCVPIKGENKNLKNCF